VKHPDTGRRVRQERPASEWIHADHPELAIVDAATWAATQARLRGQHRPTGKGGRPMRHLLSGLLRCGECGGPLVIVDRYRYGCAAAKDRGTCTSRVRVARKEAEVALLAGVQRELLSEERFREFQQMAARELKRRAPDRAAAQRELAKAQQVRDNVMAAIRAGILTPTTRAELMTAERAVEAAEAALRQPAPTMLLPRAREAWRGLVATLADAGRRKPEAREALRELIGEAVVRNENGALFAELAPSSIAMVAGAGFGRYLTEPVRIQLGRA
jgi:hypothetical protein